MGDFLGAEKINFLMSRYWRRHHGGRVGGILSIGGPEVSQGSPRVGTRRAQTPTPHAQTLSIGGYKSVQVLCAIPLLAMTCQSFGSRALWRAPSTTACGVRDYPTPDLSQRESASRSTSEKS